jgi:integrase
VEQASGLLTTFAQATESEGRPFNTPEAKISERAKSADLMGKGNRVRSVPIAGWTLALIEVWLAAAGISQGYVFRTLNRSGKLSRNCIDSQTVFSVVRHWTQKAGSKDIAPDDVQDLCQVSVQRGASIDQVSLALGHQSIQATQTYLGIELDLSDAATDHLGLGIKV